MALTDFVSTSRVVPPMRRPARGASAAAIVLAVTLMAACGGGDGDSSADSPAPTTPGPGGGGGGGDGPAVNSAPTISGSPRPSILQGSAYSFAPTAADADNEVLTFSVANLPGWASFDAQNGQISGTPAASDVGTYPDIVISVTDGLATTSLPAFSIDVVATAQGSVMLSWKSPTERTDGSPLADLAGFKIYWGTTEGNYTESITLTNPGLTSYVIEQLTPATWYFVATAFDSKGLESQFSNSASKTIQ